MLSWTGNTIKTFRPEKHRLEASVPKEQTRTSPKREWKREGGELPRKTTQSVWMVVGAISRALGENQSPTSYYKKEDLDEPEITRFYAFDQIGHEVLKINSLLQGTETRVGAMEESNSTSLQMENRHEKAQKNTVAHTAVGGQAYDGHEKPRESTTSTSAVAPSASGFTPSISWNQGSKANIRITLGFKPSGAAYTNLLRSNEIDLTSSSPAPNHLLMPIAPEQPKTIPGTSTGVAPHGTHDQQGKIANMSSNPSFVEIADDSESDSNDDGSDSGASLDDVEESDEQESGEITSGEDVPTFENIGRGGQGKYGGDSGSVEPDKETDAMKFYSDSNPSLPSFGAVNLINSTVDNAMVIQTHSNADKPTLKPEPHILADLDPEILALQIRYFYTGKDPKTVNLNDDVNVMRRSVSTVDLLESMLAGLVLRFEDVKNARNAGMISPIVLTSSIVSITQRSIVLFVSELDIQKMTVRWSGVPLESLGNQTSIRQ
ncbi:MAG: hypothetical protein MMC33_010293 [Icmadophila ericetorum]|nr:hypothetical protein [Icmadophila ericetorum]